MEQEVARERYRIAEIWSDVLRWELAESKPKLVVPMGNRVHQLLVYLKGVKGLCIRTGLGTTARKLARLRIFFARLIRVLHHRLAEPQPFHKTIGANGHGPQVKMETDKDSLHIA